MQETTCLEKQPLCQEMLEKMNAYWRAANYLSAGTVISAGQSSAEKTPYHGSYQKEDRWSLGNCTRTEFRICSLQPCYQTL